jgi:hypothetical protein
MSEIHVERDRRGYVDRMRAYRVMLDGEGAGRVKPGETLTLPFRSNSDKGWS